MCLARQMRYWCMCACVRTSACALARLYVCVRWCMCACVSLCVCMRDFACPGEGETESEHESI